MEPTRRGFLQGLLGLTVVAIVPGMKETAAEPIAKLIDPYAIKAPEGITYQWCRTSLLGEPDPENIRLRLTNGWKFVAPNIHTGAPTSKLGDAVEHGGLVLMEKSTDKVQIELEKDWKRRNLVAIAFDDDGKPIAWQFPTDHPHLSMRNFSIAGGDPCRGYDIAADGSFIERDEDA